MSWSRAAHIHARAILAVLLASAAAVAAAAAEEPPAARIGAEVIPRSRIVDLHQSTAQLRAMPLEAVYPTLLDHAVREHLVQREVDKAGLRDDPEVKRRLALVEEQLLRDIYLTRQAEKAVGDDAVRRQYDAVAERREEMRVRHIVVPDEAQARKVLARLAQGADFAALAREVSRDPSAAAGGDLGFVTRDQMPAPFSEAAFALADGEVAAAPVKTPFGWHVIRAEARRVTEPPPFETVRDEIRKVLLQQEAARYVDALVAGAAIERFGLDGAPLDTP